MFDKLQSYILFSLLGALYMAVPAIAAQDITSDLGTSLSESEIEKYAITIFPDGTGLPLGQGTAMQGAQLYKEQCMMCHGAKGIEGPAARLVGSNGWFSLSDPLRIIRIKKHPILLISVGAMWPYATTIFDYTRRAMPHGSSKSLSNDEVYALTAYILYLNELVEENAVIDKESILKVSMPGRERSILGWPEDNGQP